MWRLQNLYQVKRADTGAVIPFRPRAPQMAIFEKLLSGCRRLIIPKSRRHGMSTGIGIYGVDQALTNAGFQFSIVDQTKEDAAGKLTNICKTALEGCEALAKVITTTADNSSVLRFRVGNDAESTIAAGLRARGGTNHLLHISEWGVIQADDPKRSAEILTGALPSAEHGTIIVETTWKGGKHGELYRLLKTAMERPPGEPVIEGDWEYLFFPWWQDETLTRQGDIATIDPEISAYLREKEEELGIRFTDGQKLWYARTRSELGMFIWREFPTTIEECFKSPIDGAIYADLLDKARAQGRVLRFLPDARYPVHTSWDLGSPLNTAVWYFQIAGPEIRVIDCDLELDLTPVERAAHMLQKGYNFGVHLLPHDAGSTPTSGRTFQQEITAAGLANTRIIPRTSDIWIGINQLRGLMPRMVFRAEKCDKGLDCLDNYHTATQSAQGIARDLPVHDWTSHAADALRMLAEGMAAGLIPSGLSGQTTTTNRRPQVIMGTRR